MSREEHTVDIEYRRLTPSDISLALGMNAAANALYRKAGGEVSSDSGGDDVCYFFMPEEGAK